MVYQPVQLVQEFRDFDFMSPWEGAPHILPGDEKAAMAPECHLRRSGEEAMTTRHPRNIQAEATSPTSRS